jgi:hypothetical protein
MTTMVFSGKNVSSVRVWLFFTRSETVFRKYRRFFGDEKPDERQPERTLRQLQGGRVLRLSGSSSESDSQAADRISFV